MVFVVSLLCTPSFDPILMEMHYTLVACLQVSCPTSVVEGGGVAITAFAIECCTNKGLVVGTAAYGACLIDASACNACPPDAQYDPLCAAADVCSGHGTCAAGECTCAAGWTGPHCDQATCDCGVDVPCIFGVCLTPRTCRTCAEPFIAVC